VPFFLIIIEMPIAFENIIVVRWCFQQFQNTSVLKLIHVGIVKSLIVVIIL